MRDLLTVLLYLGLQKMTSAPIRRNVESLLIAQQNLSLKIPVPPRVNLDFIYGRHLAASNGATRAISNY